MLYKIKNISNEVLIEPYHNIGIEPGEVLELEGEKAQRVLSVFPHRTKLVVDSPKEEVKDVSEEAETTVKKAVKKKKEE